MLDVVQGTGRSLEVPSEFEWEIRPFPLAAVRKIYAVGSWSAAYNTTPFMHDINGRRGVYVPRAVRMRLSLLISSHMDEDCFPCLERIRSRQPGSVFVYCHRALVSPRYRPSHLFSMHHAINQY